MTQSVTEEEYTEPSTADPILEMQDVSVTFDMDRGVSRVLNDVTFDIERQEILGVIGESGSGKSMLASALLDAVVAPGDLSGEVVYNPLDGDPINLLDLDEKELRELRWTEISMVFQGAMSSFNPVRTIRTHFTETLNAHNESEADGMDRARELLSDLYLEPERVLDSYPHELSGGMRQRALIALSLVLDPNVLVMDEPTAALDLLMQRSILSLLNDLQQKYDLTIVFITHDLPLVIGLADRIGVMYAFNIVEYGTTEQIVSEPSHPYTRALLKSVPNLDAPLDEMQPIEGSAPDPVAVPSGCSYAPRCPLATEECRNNDPPFFDVAADHGSACFHWDQSREETSLSSDGVERGVTRTRTDDREPVVTLSQIDVDFQRKKDGLLNFFNTPDTVQAVSGVSLEVFENDVVALVGESGCGKTTLGKVAIGVQEPTEGTVEYRGHDVHAAKRDETNIAYEEIRQSLQIIHQDPGSALNPNKKVLSSLSKPLKRWFPHLDTEDRRERILGMLETVGMVPPDDYANRYPHQLSGGEKQRVVLIRALLMNPDLILADEAISALDVSLRVDTMDLMLDLQEQFDTSFLFISHDFSNARYLAEKANGRIGVMYLGKIVEIGPAEQILNNPRHPYTKLLRWSTADIEGEEEAKDPPVRTIDIPDPVNPPDGCRFHTRCPVAREVCTKEHPELRDGTDGTLTACFRLRDESHPYWESKPLDGTDPTVFDETD